MASQTALDLQNSINIISNVLQGCDPNDPRRGSWQNQLAQSQRRLAAVQRADALATVQAGPSRKRSLDLSADSSDDTPPKRFSPHNQGNHLLHAPTQQQWSLPDRSGEASRGANAGFSDYIDLTVSDPPSPDRPDPFPELVDAYRDDDRPAPADAFNQEFMRADELAQFMIAPTAVNGGYGLQRQNPVPYLPGPQRPDWLGQESDEDNPENYGDFPLNATEAESIEKMLEIVRQNGDDTQENREETPRIMSSTLKEYQKIGLSWLLKMEAGQNKGGILADEMGLGKTVSTGRNTSHIFVNSSTITEHPEAI
jgi:hypothetical protein